MNRLPAKTHHDMMASMIRAIVVLTVLATAGLPQERPSGSDLARRVFERRQDANIRARGRFVITDAAKHQKIFQLSLLQKRLPQSTNLLWSITDPPGSRMRVLVESGRAGKTTVWISSGDDAPALPIKRWSEPILGSHLTFEDLVEDHFSWPTQVLAGEEAIGERMCDIVRSEPDAQHHSAYSAVTTWVDRTTLLPLRILKKPVGSAAQKEVVFRGIRRSGGQWVASTIEMRKPGVPGSTRMVFTAGSGNAKVRDSEVDRKSVFER